MNKTFKEIDTKNHIYYFNDEMINRKILIQTKSR